MFTSEAPAGGHRMGRIATILLLVASPLVITAGLVLLGLFINGVGRAFGSTKSPTPIVLAMVGLALLHIGYYLGPLLWSNGRTSLALWLMLPVAVVAALIGMALFVRILPAASESSSNVRWFYGMLAGMAVAAGAYAAPILIMLRAAAR